MPENGAGEAMQPQKPASAKRKAPYFLRSTVLFGGEYRDRTGDLLHAMQALSRTTHSRTPTQRCEDERYSTLIRSICEKHLSHFRIHTTA